MEGRKREEGDEGRKEGRKIKRKREREREERESLPVLQEYFMERVTAGGDLYSVFLADIQAKHGRKEERKRGGRRRGRQMEIERVAVGTSTPCSWQTSRQSMKARKRGREEEREGRGGRERGRQKEVG
jgi:hypothetical protein